MEIVLHTAREMLPDYCCSLMPGLALAGAWSLAAEGCSLALARGLSAPCRPWWQLLQRLSLQQPRLLLFLLSSPCRAGSVVRGKSCWVHGAMGVCWRGMACGKSNQPYSLEAAAVAWARVVLQCAQHGSPQSQGHTSLCFVASLTPLG